MTQASNLDIHLLLAHHDDQEPVLGQALDMSSSAREPRPAIPKKRPPTDPDIDREDLAQTGWGVVVPPGARGDRLLDLVRPLIDRRRDQQGSEVRVFRSPPSPGDLSLLEAFQWRETWSDSQSSLPRYLLILGDLREVPLAVQRALSVAGNHAVGRLHFDRDDPYRSYADKVCRIEAKTRQSTRADIVLHMVKDGSQATSEGYRHLFQILADKVRVAHHARGQVRESGTLTPRPDELFTAAGSHGKPTVLFTLGHGEGAPRRGWSSREEQHRFQGAMSFGKSQRIAAEDVAEREFLAGGVWLMHGSFSAGTPLWSSYLGWLKKLAERGQHGDALARVLASRPVDDAPFTAALPQAALANPRGPLGVIGHVDVAWSHGFPEPVSAAGSRTAALRATVSALADGRRIGSSMSALFDYLGQADAYLVSLYSEAKKLIEDAAGRRERALYWMIREELSGYVLFGDPAAHLAVVSPVASAPSESARAPDISVRVECAIAEYILGQPARIALGRQHLTMSESRFIELARAYREAGLAALDMDKAK